MTNPQENSVMTHRNCGGSPVEFAPGKWECSRCHRQWHAGEFARYLARVVFTDKGSKALEP